MDFIKEANMLLYLRDGTGKLISTRFQLTGTATPSLAVAGTVLHEDVIVDEAAPPIDSKKPVNYSTENSSIDIVPGTFYRNVNFWMTEGESDKNYYSNIITVYKETEPLQRSITLNIKTKNLPASLQSKALIVKIKNDIKIPIASSFDSDRVTGKITSLGNYAVVADDENPVIGAIAQEFDTLSKCKIIVVGVTDNLSGVKKYNCFINDEWAVSEYVSRENKIVCYLKKKELTKFAFKIIVEDAKGNVTEKESKLQVTDKTGN